MIVGLLRHGRTTWNEEGRMQGRRDIPLSASGRAEVLAWRAPAPPAGAPPIEMPWRSSPLARAVETAEILSGVAPRHEPALTEMDWGEWEGFDLHTLRERHGDAFARNEAAGLDFRPPGGESPRDVRDRVVRFLAASATAHRALIVVSHKGVLRAVLSAATRWDMTAKAPLRLRRDAVHWFTVGADGQIEVLQCNLPLAAVPAVGAGYKVGGGVVP
jgi:probable phosphoglycerate mutase